MAAGEWWRAGIFSCAVAVSLAADRVPIGASPSPAVGDVRARIDALQESNPEQALTLAQTARDEASDERARLAAEVRMAGLHRLLSHYAAAIELAEKGLARATALGDTALAMNFRSVLARAHWNLGNYQRSLELHLETLREANQAGDLAMAFESHCGVSSIFGDFKQPEQALYHLEEARLLAEKLNDKVRLGDFHKILGNNAVARRDFKAALASHQQSLRLHTEAGSERGIADAWQNIGYATEQLGELPLALEHTRRSIEIYQRLGLRRHLVNAMRQSGRLRVKLGRVEEGVRELEEALALSLPLKALSLEAYAYRELARAYEVQGNFVAAYEAQRKLIATNETVFNDRSRQQLAILNSRYIEERREMEIDLLRREQALKDAELARSRAERGWLLAVAGVGVVALAAMVSRQRIKLRAEQRVVAETRAAKEAAERADQLKTRLLSIASHDLKNPVATVMGGLLELRESAPEEKEFIDGLLVESERMLALIRDLLDLAALENGQLRLSPAALDLVPLVGDVVTTQQPRARVKQIELRLDPASVGAARVQGDANRLRQVLVNLVDNALKFTPPGGAVTVALKQADAQIEVSITDTGPGMTPEDMANLFTPFASLSAKPTGGEKSTGLGLSICHELVAMHRGRLDVRSVPGAGATFAVVLPADGATQV